MSFQTEQYYKKLCDMLIMQIMNPFHSNGIDKEVLRRDAVSRLYYTGYLHCLNTLQLSVPKDGGSHNYVLDKINNEDRYEMLHLKKLRKDADYSMNSFPETLKFKTQQVTIQRLKAIVETILLKDESTLSA